MFVSFTLLKGKVGWDVRRYHTLSRLEEIAYRAIDSQLRKKIRASVAGTTHTTIPSQVIKIVQLNPNIDINPKFR